MYRHTYIYAYKHECIHTGGSDYRSCYFLGTGAKGGTRSGVAAELGIFWLVQTNTAF